MADINDINEYNEQEKAKLPSGLNVLTILTFIGCSLGALFTLCTPLINKWLMGFMDKALSSGQEISADKMAEIEKGKAMMEQYNQNMIPIMVISLVGIALCFVGALWMRKLKKDGYWMYVAGEIAPIIAMLFILGTAQYNGVFSIIIGLCIPATFVILYTVQRKYLTK